MGRSRAAGALANRGSDDRISQRTQLFRGYPREYADGLMASIDSRRSHPGKFSQLASSFSDLACKDFEPFLQLPHKGWAGSALKVLKLV